MDTLFLNTKPFIDLLVTHAKLLLEREGCVLSAQTQISTGDKLSVELEYYVDQHIPLSHLFVWARPLMLTYQSKSFTRIEICVVGNSVKPSQIKELLCCPSSDLSVNNIGLVDTALKIMHNEIQGYLAR